VVEQYVFGLIQIVIFLWMLSSIYHIKHQVDEIHRDVAELRAAIAQQQPHQDQLSTRPIPRRIPTVSDSIVPPYHG
jgi:cell division protein FtsL